MSSLAVFIRSKQQCYGNQTCHWKSKRKSFSKYWFSCTLLGADLSEIGIIWISCTNKLSALGFLFGFTSCKGSFSCIYPKATLWDLLLRKMKALESVFKHLELCRRKCLQHNQFSSFSLEHQEEYSTAILESLQKDFQRTALAYRKITEEKGKMGEKG